MIDVIEIHMEGPEHVQHIAKLRWVEVDVIGGAAKTQPKESTRAAMYQFVKDNPDTAFAISQNDKTFAYLEPVEAHVHYVRTAPDSTKSDNLLSLPRF
jgi:uncharacterized protein (DUF2461 family)